MQIKYDLDKVGIVPMQIKYDLDKVGIDSRLQEERIRAGHTQESLAEAMGITDKYICKVENWAAAPSLSYVMKFSDITKTDVRYLLRGIKSKADKSSDVWMVKEGSAPYVDTSQQEFQRRVRRSAMR